MAQAMTIIIKKKDGIIQKIGKGVIWEPKTNFSGKPMRWYEDKYKQDIKNTGKEQVK
jgi:hypothetical protein